MYELNPCKVCTEFFKDKGCNVNDINNCCYDIYYAFNRVPEIDSVVKIPDESNCESCVENILKKMGPFPNGLTCCDLKISPPAIFNQVPHYLPELLTQKMSISEAKNKCIDMCKKNTKNVNECIDRCNLDSDALENIIIDDNKNNKKNDSIEIVKSSTTTVQVDKNDKEKINKFLILIFVLFFSYSVYLINK